MKINKILQQTDHRPWALPAEKWKYYQEWSDAIFLHWQVNLRELQQFVPQELDVDLFEGKPWVSIVAFNMENIRSRYLPAFKPISNFHELNIRTYVHIRDKSGVYFLSIEGSKKLSCKVARRISALPYRYSDMHREDGRYLSSNAQHNDRFEVQYSIGHRKEDKTSFDSWITERYALFQDTPNAINSFDIHHLEWPVYDISLKNIEISYPRFEKLLNKTPDKAHYSPGVQVMAWGKDKLTKNAIQ